MKSGSYSLVATVSYLESVLEAFGYVRLIRSQDESRRALRERFRVVARVFRRLELEHTFQLDSWSRLAAGQRSTSSVLDWEPLSIVSMESDQKDNVFTWKARSAREERLPHGWEELCRDSSSLCDGRPNSLPPPAPFLSKEAARLDVAVAVARDGLTSVYAAVMDLWSRRHEILQSDAASKKQPRRRRSIDRLLLALMRFVFGFFGSHKVDARNNP